MADTPCRCLGCGLTHEKCETQRQAERLAHQLAAALETRDQLARTQALVDYDRWRGGLL